MIAKGLATAQEAIFDLDFHAVMHWGTDPAWKSTTCPRARSAPVGADLLARTPAPQPGLRNAGLTKATQHREVITFCDHWKAASGADPKMLIMDQKVTTQAILGELDGRGVKFAALRMRSRPWSSASTPGPRRLQDRHPEPASPHNRPGCARTPP